MIRFLYAVLFLLLPAFALSQQQSGSLRVTATLGHDGFYRPDKWTPIFVEISNQPAEGGALASVEDFRGQLMLMASPADSGAMIRFTREVDVPRSSTKRYVLYARVPDDGSKKASVSLLVNAMNGRNILRIPLNGDVVPKQENLVVAVSDEIPRFSLPSLPLSPVATKNARISFAALPDFWAGWDPADVVVFPGWSARGMNPAAAEALRDWIIMGGTVVFLGGTYGDLYLDPVVRDLLPVTISGSKVLSYDANTGWSQNVGDTRESEALSILVSDVTRKPGAQVRHEILGTPIMVTKKLGNGNVVFIGSSLDTPRDPIRTELATVFDGIVPLPNILASRYDLEKYLPTIQGLTDTEASPPNSVILILICLVYAIVVGPVNFLILSKKKKIDLAWITLPTIVVVFFLAIYGIGRVTRTSADLLRELIVEEYHQGQSEGRLYSVLHTFTSEPGTYQIIPNSSRIAVADPARWHQEESITSDRFGFTSGASQVIGGGNISGRLAEVSFITRTAGNESRDMIGIPGWAMGNYDARTFTARGPSSMDGAIDASLEWKDYGISGEIANNTGRSFKRAYLVCGTAFLSLGELADGSVYTVPEGLVIPSFEFAGGTVRRPSLPNTSGVRWATLSELPLPVDNQQARLDEAKLADFNITKLLQEMRQSRRNEDNIFSNKRNVVQFIGIEEFTRSSHFTSTIPPEKRGYSRATVVELAPRLDLDRFNVPNLFTHVALLHSQPLPGVISTRAYQGDRGQIALLNSDLEMVIELPDIPEGYRINNLILNWPVTAPTTSRISAELLGTSNRPRWMDVSNATTQGNRLRMVNNDIFRPNTRRLYLRLRSEETGTTALMHNTPLIGLPTADVELERISEE